MDELHSELRSLPASSEEKHRRSSSSSEETFALTTTKFDRSLRDESEYETCPSDLDDEEESPRFSRTDSGVSLTTTQVFRRQSSTTTTGKKMESIISSIFDGSIQSEIECLTCNRRSKRLETFQDLSLPIPSREQLEVNDILLVFSERKSRFFPRNSIRFN